MGIRGRPSKGSAPKRYNMLTEEEYLNRALQTPGQLDSAEWRWAFETLKQIRAAKRRETTADTKPIPTVTGASLSRLLAVGSRVETDKQDESNS